jgi:hypothetical protein
MLIEIDGGFDYTAKDCQEWMGEVGFLEMRVEPLVGLVSIVIGTEAARALTTGVRPTRGI